MTDEKYFIKNIANQDMICCIDKMTGDFYGYPLETLKNVLNNKEKQLAQLKNKLDASELEAMRWQEHFNQAKLDNECLEIQLKEYHDWLDEYNLSPYQIMLLITGYQKQLREKNQNKIELTIAELEKVKEWADKDFRKNCYINSVELDKFIDNQVKELRKDYD